MIGPESTRQDPDNVNTSKADVGKGFVGPGAQHFADVAQSRRPWRPVTWADTQARS